MNANDKETFMLSNVMKRTGLVISSVWVVVGGYYIYLNNSYQEDWDIVRNICALGSAEECAEITSKFNDTFSPEWATISLYVLMGLLAIWGALFAIAWIQRGKTPS